ncbi:hypothetical protein BURPS1710b_1123 [Burkholderia pseudomallei 1710b]|uniref:Uncharacterized protein n=1 Tax=Burkholderia pseudomallei (strain 1710b) TaxID=320372 RepID=Q3JV68_BURP1|nr:hypothetical protein BURPS1710b_1123 [Burkholderia pseudomallei 1710b]
MRRGAVRAARRWRRPARARRRSANSVGGRRREAGRAAARRATVLGEVRARVDDVLRDRARERFEIDEFRLVAQLLQEFDANELAVCIAVPVEQVHFEQHAAGIVDGRPHAEARDARQRLGREAVHAHDEDARQGRALVSDRQVQRREAEVAAELQPVRDVAADRIAVAERARGGVEISRRERGAHAGTRNARAIGVGERFHLLDLEAEALARRLQRREIARAPRAVAEVVADHDPAGVQPVDERAFDERLGRLARERMVEVLDDHAVDAVLAQRLELVAQHRDARRRARRIEELARMRLERHHAHGQPARVRRRAHAREQGLVAAMDTVEVADRQRARGAALGVGQAAEDFHDSG